MGIFSVPKDLEETYSGSWPICTYDMEVLISEDVLWFRLSDIKGQQGHTGL